MAGKAKKKARDRDNPETQQEIRQRRGEEGTNPEDKRYDDDEVAIEKVPPVKTVTGEGNDADDMVDLSISDPGNPVEDNQVALYTEDDGIREEFHERQNLNAGSQELLQKLEQNNSLSPDISADDVDAAWDNADQAGEETVGGTNPTPDQDIVDDLGEAAGLTYKDHEALNFDKVYKRDADRWELNPESAVELEEDLEEEKEDNDDKENNEWSDFLDRNVSQPRDMQGFQIVDDEDEVDRIEVDEEEDESYLEDELDEADLDEEEDLEDLEGDDLEDGEFGFEEMDDLDVEDLDDFDIDTDEDALS